MVVSACDRAEREFFSDFAGRSASGRQARKSLRAIVLRIAICRNQQLVKPVRLANMPMLAQSAEIDNCGQHHGNKREGR
jgi:hypothetical protein